MSNVRWDMAGASLLGTSKVTISTDTTTAFDFGTPNDLNLASLSGYTPGDRVLLVLSASTAGTTDNLTWVVQDAPDDAGSIGTPATASTSVLSGALASTTGDAYTVVAVQVQPDRPWLRVSVDSDGATDTFVTHCVALAVPNGV